MRKKIGFIYFDELQHIHHFLSPAVELAKYDVQVDIITYEANHEYLRGLIDLMGCKRINLVMLSTYLYRKLIEKISSREQPSALYIYEKHIKRFLEYDALIYTDHTAGKISVAKGEATHPMLFLLGHGAGDRAYGYKETHNLFDVVIVAGTKKFERMKKVFPKHKFELKIGGYGKFDIIEKENKVSKLFDNSQLTLLYCPHFESGVSSWHSDGQAILNYFLKHTEYNLIFAPHFNLFNKKAAKESKAAVKDYINAPNIHIDLGSINSTNMSYILGSDIYLGDVSSQVYEYMYNQRPMVFYNAHNINWEKDENYAMWHLGKVVDSIDKLDNALLTVDMWSPEYELKQKELYKETFNQTSERAGSRIAKIIKEAI